MLHKSGSREDTVVHSTRSERPVLLMAAQEECGLYLPWHHATESIAGLHVEDVDEGAAAVLIAIDARKPFGEFWREKPRGASDLTQISTPQTSGSGLHSPEGSTVTSHPYLIRRRWSFFSDFIGTLLPVCDGRGETIYPL